MSYSVSRLFLFAAAVSMCGCDASAGRTATNLTGRANLVATTGMVADLVRHVAGERARVIELMGSGVDPHLYKPTGSDIADIMRADAVFYSGLRLEGPMQETFERAAARGRVIVAVTQNLPRASIRYPSGISEHPDPHVWMDVGLWLECLDPIVVTLSRLAPEHGDEFEQNATAYRSELKQLDASIRAAIATIPPSRRFLVTAHDAFDYFSRAYDIPVRSVQGITTESEAGVSDINELVQFLVREKVPALFVESSVSSRNLQAVLEGVRQRGGHVEVGGMLYSDAMGPPGAYEGTYVGMLDHNATTITLALQGVASKHGFYGRLAESESR